MHLCPKIVIFGASTSWEHRNPCCNTNYRGILTIQSVSNTSKNLSTIFSGLLCPCYLFSPLQMQNRRSKPHPRPELVVISDIRTFPNRPIKWEILTCTKIYPKFSQIGSLLDRMVRTPSCSLLQATEEAEMQTATPIIDGYWPSKVNKIHSGILLQYCPCAWVPVACSDPDVETNLQTAKNLASGVIHQDIAKSGHKMRFE